MEQVAMDPSGYGYAFGDCGMIFSTDNFGQNWAMSLIEPTFLFNMSIAPNSDGRSALLIGHYDLMLTTDGGQNWNHYRIRQGKQRSL